MAPVGKPKFVGSSRWALGGWLKFVGSSWLARVGGPKLVDRSWSDGGCFMNIDFETCRQSTKRARPTSLPPAWASAKWIQPRRVVEHARISQFFLPARIKSSHCFFTTSAYLADRFNPLRRPARILTGPFLSLPALSGMPLALVLPALSGLPLVLPALPGLPPVFPTDRAPLLTAFLPKQFEHNFERLVCTLRPHLLLQWGNRSAPVLAGRFIAPSFLRT